MDKEEQDEAMITILRQVESGVLSSDAAFLQIDALFTAISKEEVEQMAKHFNLI